jgi:transcriptional regulator with PAS, ATPase and Fis domain
MQGLFEAANGGTLFLDEIGDASLALQGKLLRALQEKKITPVGSTREIEVDVRIVAATHRNLEAMLKNGSFREDLYYRLNVISIEVPPLRDRIEDIQPIVLGFLKKYNEGRTRPKQILLKTVKMLESYEWPGNVRELLNYVEQLLVNSPTDKITPEHLDGKFFKKENLKSDEQTLLIIMQRQEREQREYIASIVQNHSVRGAAKKMGVSKSTLHNMMKRFGLLKVEVPSQSGGLSA